MSTLATTNLKNPSSGSDNIVLGTDGSSTLGTAKLTTLADSAGANTSTPAEIASGRAKAWVNFDGTGTPAIRASYNVSSITDNGTGDYTVNFTNALADANYGFTFGKDAAPSDGPSGTFNSVITAVTILGSSLRVRNIYSNGVIGDTAACSVAIFR
jgi:hypothetical protein